MLWIILSRRVGMKTYEAPTVIDLGSVAELTLGTCLSMDDAMAGGTVPLISDACLG
jgi:hypothetical protein